MTLQLNEQEQQLLKNVLHALYKTFRREPGMNIGSCQCSNVYPDDLKTLIDLHERLADGTKQPEKVWVFTQESNVNGEYLFNVNVCKDKEAAIRMMKQEIDTLLDETTPYEGARQWMEGGDGLNTDDCPYSWENEDDDKFFIKTNCDDYYELLKVEEMEIKG